METKIEFIMKAFLCLLISIGIVSCTNIQRHSSQTDKAPENLEECLDNLMHELSSKQLNEIKQSPDVSRYHFTLGRFLRNNWIRPKSPLESYFNSLGIDNYEDMSGIILFSLHQRLNNLDIKLDEQIKCYNKFWEEVARQKKQGLDVIKSDLSCLESLKTAR